MHHTQRKNRVLWTRRNEFILNKDIKTATNIIENYFGLQIYALSTLSDTLQTTSNINLDRQLIFNLDNVRQSMNLLTHCSQIRKWKY